MEWNNNEQKIKKGMGVSTKVLLAIIFCIIVIISLVVLLITIKTDTTPSVTIYVDGQVSQISQDALLLTIDNNTYVNIEEFAKLVGYEYHIGEYKHFSQGEDKCYVQGIDETASFFINDNKVYKLHINKMEEEYKEYTVEQEVKKIGEKMYASVEAINKAFNVAIKQTIRSFEIYTLNYLVDIYNTSVIEWGYTSIAEQKFENKKSILYGYLIVNKENGLYKIIDLENTKEIVPDKYTSIEFLENTQEFIVKNSSSKVGIVDFNGTIKLDLIYESIEILDKESDLYIIKQSGKYGVVKSGDIIKIYPEYDSIGINNSEFISTMNNKYLILDTLIPVYKGEKCGAYNKEGEMIFPLEYDGFGYELNNIEIDGKKNIVKPLLTIERCEGIVVKKNDKYGLIKVNGEELVPIAVDGIYQIEDVENEDEKYFMLYIGKKMNVIERLIIAGKIEKIPIQDETSNNQNDNTIENTIEDNNSNINN